MADSQPVGCAMAMAERDRRVAENESIFRDVNEVRARGFEGDRVAFLCECADIACKERITLRRREYELVRSDARQFVLIPGHELLEAEEVVMRQERFLLVRKFGAAGEIAEELEPRSPRRRPPPPDASWTTH
jgi:hypothetical protein